MDQDATYTEVNLGPGNVVLDGVAASSRPIKVAELPSFRPMSVVATVAHLSYCWVPVHKWKWIELQGNV